MFTGELSKKFINVQMLWKLIKSYEGNIVIVIKFTLLVETGSMHLLRLSRRRSFSHKVKPCDLCYCWMRECKICKAQGTEEPAIESNMQPCFSNVVPASWSNSPTNVQQDAFKSDPVFSLQTKGSAYGLRYPIIFSDFSYCYYWKQISGELCQCTEEEHKNFCFSLAGALGGLMALVMVLVITWVVVGGGGGGCWQEV